MMRQGTIVFGWGLMVCLLMNLHLWSENGVSDKEIVLGQSCALGGPAQALGQGMRAGLLAYFKMINEKGGIKGRQIRLISLDDGYEPARAILNTRNLINQEKVFLLVGEVGTPTSKAVVPIIEKMKVPFVGPFTGAEFLRNPYKHYVVNVRGSYYQEMERLAQYLVDKKGLKRIACFYQNDGYGQAGLNGIKLALKRRSMELIGTGTYERNTLAVRSGLLAIRRSKPDAVIMVGAYKPCATFIKLAKKVGMKKTIFCNISFVGTEALRKELGPDGEGCIISQVVVYPWNTSIPLVKEYHEAMKKYEPTESIGFVSLEGFMVAKFLCQALLKCPTLDRETLLQTINQTAKFDLGGMTLEYGEKDHQGMDQVFLTVIKNGKVVPLDE